MIFGAIDPLKSRVRYKSRSLEIFACSTVLFFLLVVAFSWLSANVFSSLTAMLVGDVVAFGIGYFLYLQWHNQPMRIRCESCRAVVASNTPWVCGVCGKQNTDGNTLPFLDRCAECGAEPKSYKCHHCGELIFLSEDRDTKNAAQRLVSEASKSKRRAKLMEKKSETHEDKKHQIEMIKMDLVEAKLNENLEVIKKRMVNEPEKTDLEAQLKSLKQHMDTWTAVDEAARQQKRKNAEDCHGDSKERKRRDLIVDDWVFRKKSEEQ